MKDIVKKFVIVLTAIVFSVSATGAAAPIPQEELDALNGTWYWYDPTPVQGCGFVAGDVELAAGENKKAAFLYFIQRGLSPNASAGFVGNLEAESKVLPTADEPDKGTARGGYGIAQWTAGRRVAIENFARDIANHKPPEKIAEYKANSGDGTVLNSLLFQLDYLWEQELEKGYKPSVLTPLQSAASIKQASDIVLHKFEIPQVIVDGIPGPIRTLENYRASLGTKIFELYGSEAGSVMPVGSTPTSSGCPDQPGGTAQFVGFPLDATKAKMAQLNGGCFNATTQKMCTGGHPYTAWDIMADTGTKTLNLLNGTVDWIGRDCGGTMISVYSAAEDVTISYLHQSADIKVKEGDTVTPGQHISNVGTRADACNTDPHLHIDVVTGKPRPSCSRQGCPAANMTRFVAGEAKINMASGLYQGYTKLP